MHIDQPSDHLGREALVVRAILQRWDPIGSIGFGGPVDECDDLIKPILDLMASDTTAEILASELQQVLRTDYGLSRSWSECHGVAAELLAACR